VKVRHYRGTADIARAAQATPAADRAPLLAAAKGFTVTSVPFDAWLDEAGRLRELSQRFTFSTAASTSGSAQDGTSGSAQDGAQGNTEGSTQGSTQGSTPGNTPESPQGSPRTGRPGSTPPARRNVTVVSTTRYDHFGIQVSVIMPRPADIWTGKIVSAQPG
jgi:hypothetical protein